MSATDPASRPLVSFATTAFRTEQYVTGTIETVLAQTDPDWELVVVDNGPVDTMAEIVGRYTHDPRVRLVRQDNAGYIGGLEAAVAHTTGRWVVPLDSDDQVVPELVARVRALEARFPDAVALACDAHLFSDEHDEPIGFGYDRGIGAKPTPKQGEALTRHHLFAGRTPYYGGAVRREAWLDIGGYVTSAEDVDEVIDFWLRLLDRGPVMMVPDRLGRYRVRTDSLTRDPATVENYERLLLNTFVVHGASADPGEQVAATRTMSTLLYYQALRRARTALTHGEIATARMEARTAMGHRRTARSVAVVALMHTAPRLALRLHPVKQQVTDWLLTHVPRRGRGREASDA